ncbi:MAG: B12-binding domain-containing radical SAM protein [Candidatus Hodarchaeota archaeon]
MRIALINPNPILEEHERFYGQKWPPLGIILLGTILKQQGHQVKLLDQASNGFNFNHVLEWIKRVDPEVIGISAMTVGFLSSIKISQMAKNWNPNVIIVLGHYHPTICADNILKKYGHLVDYCVRGENDYIFSNLINYLENNHSREPSDLLGISYRFNGKIKHNPDGPINKSLDDLPFPNRSLLKNSYRQNLAGIQLMDSKLATTFFTRGCPYSCTYCAVSKFSNRQYRSKSPERLVEEFSYLASRGYSEIAFVDDNFSLNLRNVVNFCKLLIKENLDINWHVEMRVDQVSKELFQYMALAGCKSISFGIESANPRILNYYNKNITPDQSLRAIKMAKEARIDFIIGLFMLGAPFETISECENTIHFALNSGVDFFFLNIVETWPGIPMWDDLVSKGLINGENMWENSTRVMDLTHSEAQRKKILNMVRKTYREYISFKRIGLGLKLLPDMLLSQYKRRYALNFLKHLRSGMRTVVRLRNLNLSGFGKFSTSD